MNMIEPQPMTQITTAELTAKAAEFQKQGYRLVQVCATTGAENFEVTYSFDKDYAMANLRLSVPRNGAVLPSITASYLAAFTYENELQDLFGIKITDCALNFNGNFYRIAMKTPFAQPKTN